MPEQRKPDFMYAHRVPLLIKSTSCEWGGLPHGAKSPAAGGLPNSSMQPPE